MALSSLSLWVLLSPRMVGARSIEPSGGAATKGEGVLTLSAAPAVGKVPNSKEFAERYTMKEIAEVTQPDLAP